MTSAVFITDADFNDLITGAATFGTKHHPSGAPVDLDPNWFSGQNLSALNAGKVVTANGVRVAYPRWPSPRDLHFGTTLGTRPAEILARELKHASVPA